ncbi:MAG: YidC/Oxa1 family membrane protein insertase [Candidatus Nomurabacteria bacterium]|nr:YidC/Oxa1 family membrane protein insertase [Candidatus Nomurabacteria bacterium]
MINLWNTFLYGPLFNALAFLVSIVPGGDVGIAVILLTIIVKTVLFPLSQRSIESQIKMNLLAPELKKIKDSGTSKEEQAKQTFELYKHHKTNPFSGCLLVLIQIPIIFALYYVFLKELNFQSTLLYPFIHAPEDINMLFLGILDISQKGLIILAVLAGLSQYFQARLMPKPVVQNKTDSSFQENLTNSMQTQMKYVFPFVIAFIAYSVSGAVALYWITSNIFAIGQQIYANKKKKLALEKVGP